MLTSIAVLLVAAALTAAAAYWVLRAYRFAGGGAQSAQPALIATGLLSIITLVTYLAMGRPELPDAPFAARLEALKHRDPVTYTAEEALAVLAQASKQHAQDPLPHVYSGQLLLDQGRAEEAARAFDAALRRDPNNAEAMLGLGRAMVRSEGGRVSPDALALFQQVAPLTSDPAPWLYQAMAAMQEGREADARRLWGEATSRMAPDDPRRAMMGQFGQNEGAQ